MHLRSDFFTGEDFRHDVAGGVAEPELFRGEADLGRSSVVAGVQDGHGGRVVALVGRHDRTHEDVDLPVLEIGQK